MVSNVFISIVILSVQSVRVESVFKRWKPNTNFENPENWNVGRVPCGSDVVKFTGGNALSPTVFVQTNSTMKEMWLPMNGEIIFGANSIMSFTDSAISDASCPDVQGELEFIRGPKDWIDPDNWCHAQSELGDCHNPLLLESEKVPGQYDDTVFPTEKSFFVSLGVKMNLAVRSLKISGSSLNTGSFTTFVKSAEGTRMFPPPQIGTGTMSTITITRSKCKTPRSGCSNGNAQPQILNEICKVYKDRCDRARCKSPLTPLGGCCPMCGALFNVTIDTGFNLTEFKGLLLMFIKDVPDAQMIISRLSLRDNLVQMVIRDKTGESSSKVASIIKQDLDKDLQYGGHKYAISAVSMAISGSATDGRSTSGHTGNLSGSSVAGIVLAVVIFVPIIVIIAFYLWSTKTHKRNVITNTIDGMKSRVSQLGGHRGSDRSPFAQELDTIQEQTSFENQMYGAHVQDLNIQEFNLSLSSQPATFDRSGFDNPLYKDMSSLYSDASTKDNT